MTITLTRKVGEIAAETPGMARVFEKLGIDYCCGGHRTLQEACAVAHVDYDQALSAMENNAQPARASKNWQSEPLTDLLAHIQTKHHAFVRSETGRIEALLVKVVSAHGSKHPELVELQQTFGDLAEELAVHLMKEEQVLFPYVVSMEECVLAGEAAPPAMCGSIANPIRVMMMEHDGAGDALRQMRSITHNYQLPDDACASYRQLYIACQEFEADLHQHIHLENNILFPRSLAMQG